MQYLTYEQYQDIGGTLDLTAFIRNIDRACAFIDSHTFNRLRDCKEYSSNVKACVRDLVEMFASRSAVSNGKAVTSRSQSAGGVSESESYAQISNEETGAEMERIVCEYLIGERNDYGTPLMYRGAMR